MKFLNRKLCLASALLVNSVGFCQVDDIDNPLTRDSSAFQYNAEKKPFKSDVNSHMNKDYGVSGYSVIYQASSASGVDDGADSTYYGGGCIYMPAGTTGLARYDIPLQIPTGHQILGMRYAYFDNSASSTTAVIYSIDNATGTFTDEHTISSTGDTGYNSEYVSLTGGLDIDNVNYKYGIRFWSNEAGIDQRMCALRIEVNSNP